MVVFTPSLPSPALGVAPPERKVRKMSENRDEILADFQVSANATSRGCGGTEQRQRDGIVVQNWTTSTPLPLSLFSVRLNCATFALGVPSQRCLFLPHTHTHTREGTSYRFRCV